MIKHFAGITCARVLKPLIIPVVKPLRSGYLLLAMKLQEAADLMNSDVAARLSVRTEGGEGGSHDEGQTRRANAERLN